MRNNSLRQQAWQNKQQATIFKKVALLTPNESIEEVQHVQTQPNSYKTKYHQHSELKWLEKLMNQMNNFKEGQKVDIALKQKKNQEKKQVLHETVSHQKQMSPTNRTNLSTNKVGSKPEEVKKSGRKIKFEIISNKQNKHPSQKKSLGASCKSNDKFKNKSNKKIIQTPIIKAEEKVKSKQVKMKQQNNPKLVQISNLITESFAVQQQCSLKNAESLWKNKSKDIQNQQRNIAFSQERTRKSVGKIVRNSNSQIKTEHKIIKSLLDNNKPLSVSKQMPKTTNREENTSKKKPQKVYIKLQTEKLSKYLSQSQVQQNTNLCSQEKSINLDSEQFKKYCPTKRGDHIVIRAVNCTSNTDSDIKNIDKTAIIQRKKNVERNMKTADPNIYKQKEIKQNSNYLSYKKEKGKLIQPFHSKVPCIQKTKSQQRKLNQVSRNVTQNESVSEQMKFQQPQLIPSFSFKNNESPIKVKQLQIFWQKPIKIELQSNNLKKSLKEKDKKENVQKIFTLNSDGEQETNEEQTKKLQQEQIILLLKKQSQNLEKNQINDDKVIEREHQIEVQTIPTQIQNILIQSSNKNKQKNIPFLRQSNSSRQDVEIDNPNYTQMLKQLFNYLDEGKRGLLTNSNCKADKLTQQLKLLLCPVVNQIKSKKKTYALQKFISEGQQVLKIKQEVFKSSKNQTKKTNVSEILKENVQILLKRAPLQFLQQTHTYSFYENDQNSKRESLQDKHSIVISKFMMNEKTKNNTNSAITEKGPKIEHKKRQSEIDLQQPEIYFQKKYGIQNLQLNPSSQSKSVVAQKKVGVYKNLKETYVKLDI